MNLSLYSIKAFLILDSEGHRVLAKYYRPKNHPNGESQALPTLKEQRPFEKGLWQKTKKPGGAVSFSWSAFTFFNHPLLLVLPIKRRHHPVRLASRGVQAFPRCHILSRRGSDRERVDDKRGFARAGRCAAAAASESSGEAGRVGEP